MMKSKKELFRNEWKYLISVGEKELLRLRMSPFLHLDPHADEGGYMIRSLYFDDYWNSAYEEKEAAEYIEKYFETYPKIKGFLDGLVADGREKGYVSTMLGRRRPIPELKSGNFMQRSFGERVAMNSPIQGTAADIIKIAMNRVYQRLKEEGLQSRLVLQVHDELLIETKK